MVLATHRPLTAFFTGVATALGAGVSMAFSEGLSDTGDLTGRGSPVLSFPGVTGAIVGARSPRQVDGWLPAANLELKEDDLADIAAAIHATGAGTGPVAPPPAGA